MVAALDLLHVPPRPWHIVGLDVLTHLYARTDFDSVLMVVDHLTRMAHFFPYTKEITVRLGINHRCIVDSIIITR
jgi:hypothetical protein